MRPAGNRFQIADRFLSKARSEHIVSQVRVTFGNGLASLRRGIRQHILPIGGARFPGRDPTGASSSAMAPMISIGNSRYCRNPARP